MATGAGEFPHPARALSALLVFAIFLFRLERYQIDRAVGEPIGVRIRWPFLDAPDELRLALESLQHLVPVLNLGVGNPVILVISLEDQKTLGHRRHLHARRKFALHRALATLGTFRFQQGEHLPGPRAVAIY